jgi:hypothetical protein
MSATFGSGVRARVLLTSALATLILAACSDRSATAPAPEAASARPSTQAGSHPAALSIVTQALARAMTDGAIRQQLLEDLRDSPFPHHKLHVESYLRGRRGGRIATAAAMQAGIRADSLVALLRQLPSLEISLPLAADRIRWLGTGDAVVVGTLATRAELPSLKSLPGYATRDGAPVVVPIGEELPYPLIAIVPVEKPFEADPEAVRQRAPRQDRRTVSTADLEFSVQTSEPIGSCDSPAALQECGDAEDGGGHSGGYFGGGATIPSGHTFECFTEVGSWGDNDRDGLYDYCEAEIAYALRPFLQFSRYEYTDCREPYFAVRRGSASNEIKIMYLLSYYRDDGAEFAYGDVGEHWGDNEFLVYTVEYYGGQQGRWRLKQAFLSAHYNKWGFDSSSTRSYEVFTYPDGTYRGRPKIWVAESKHANYHSQTKCDEGANYYDTCDNPRSGLSEADVSDPDWNIGNNANGGVRLKDCVPSRGYVPGVATRSGVECFWTGSEFRGWHNFDGAAAGSYRGPLNDFGF